MKKPVSRSLGRKRAFRQPARVFYLVCEGEKTETGYFRFFNQIRYCSVRINVSDQNGVPKTLLETAKKIRKKLEKNAGDEVWIVCDRDEHPDIPNVIAEAKRADINLAFSDPCFELWLLLHFQDHNAKEHRHVLQPRLRNHLHGFTKELSDEHFFALANGYSAAHRRAIALDKARGEEGRPYANPSTSTHELVRRILRAVRDFHRERKIDAGNIKVRDGLLKMLESLPR